MILWRYSNKEGRIKMRDIGLSKLVTILGRLLGFRMFWINMRICDLYYDLFYDLMLFGMGCFFKDFYDIRRRYIIYEKIRKYGNL